MKLYEGVSSLKSSDLTLASKTAEVCLKVGKATMQGFAPVFGGFVTKILAMEFTFTQQFVLSGSSF